MGEVCGGAPSRGPSQELVDAALVAAPRAAYRGAAGSGRKFL
jgi:hypothetical protein